MRDGLEDGTKDVGPRLGEVAGGRRLPGIVECFASRKVNASGTFSCPGAGLLLTLSRTIG